MSDGIPNAKRPLTDRAHEKIREANVDKANGISPDLNVALQNVGSRIRKSVTEGYRRATSTPPAPHASTSRSIFEDDTPIFRSARDTYDSIYATPRPLARFGDTPQWHHSSDTKPFPAVGNKRVRNLEDDELTKGAQDNDMDTDPEDEVEGDGDQLMPLPSNTPASDAASRPIRPLGRPLGRTRGLLKTQSLPVGSLTFSKP